MRECIIPNTNVSRIKLKTSVTAVSLKPKICFEVKKYTYIYPQYFISLFPKSAKAEFFVHEYPAKDSPIFQIVFSSIPQRFAN